MAATQIVLDIFFVIVIGLMFAIMVMAARAADLVKKSSATTNDVNLQKAHKNATRAAVVSGITVGILIVIIIVQFV